MARKFKLKVDEKVWKQGKRRLTTGLKQTQIGWFGVLYPEWNNYLPVAQVAKWNEEGHMNGGLFNGTRTPPRPFLRTVFLYGMELYFNDHAGSFARQVFEGTATWQQLAEETGKGGREILQTVIDNKEKPPNAPVTVEMKGFNNPLIESGYMRDTISFVVKAKRKSKAATND